MLKEARTQETQLQPIYHELACCTTSIPPALEERVCGEIDSLKRASANLKAAQQKAADLEDELSARLRDEGKSVNRKWYLPNPPSNASIDLKEQESQHFARGMNGYKIMLILFLGSFLGVVVELLWCFVTHGYLESRSGLVYGPFNMLYGVGAAALSIVLYRFRNRGRWLSFLGSMAIGSVVEYGCSWVMETVFGSKSWDYSAFAFNLNGRICLLYSIFWGCLGVVWIKDIYPRMAKWILKLPNQAGRMITWVLMIFLAVNCLVSGVAVLRWSERHKDVPAVTTMQRILDERFPDERMERIYANMVFE
ncbi:MAG: putative ABC transporter permease [Aristaeellaceae bacterium]